jgi:hypothetical protein
MLRKRQAQRRSKAGLVDWFRLATMEERAVQNVWLGRRENALAVLLTPDIGQYSDLESTAQNWGQGFVKRKWRSRADSEWSLYSRYNSSLGPGQKCTAPACESRLIEHTTVLYTAPALASPKKMRKMQCM